MSKSTPIWRLKKAADRRFRAGHPWIYSNELQQSPKGIEPGTPVGLQDAAGKFLAWGYGNPGSLIAFRAMSRTETESAWKSPDWFAQRLKEAWRFRKDLGLTDASFRWVFGENDGLPGLVVDRYRLESGEQLIAVQAHTAGIDRALPEILSAIETNLKGSESPVGIVIRNDLSVRKLEGIPVEEPRLVREIPSIDLTRARILVRGADGKPQVFVADLLQGQKTGFFLDQSENVRQLATLLSQAALPKTVRILDLCCYAGQWSAKLAQYLKARGHEVETTLVDASESALALARANAETAGARVQTMKGDVLEDLPTLPAKVFDIVISDPPALIKGRKDIPQGTHAYLKLNTEALRLTAASGVLVACSCSQLLEEEEFMRVLAKAGTRANRSVRWIVRGTQALDHPTRLEFAEGKYLKMWVGRVSSETN